MAFWKKKNDNENMDFENDYYEDDNVQDYDAVEDEQDYVEPELAPSRSAKVIRMNDNTKDMETNTEMNMIIFRPTEYDQAQTIIDYLKLRKPIIVNLDERCKKQQMGEGWFATIDDVPKQAYTMGIWGIMQAKKILLVANGKNKAAAIKAAVTGPIDPKVPASILQLHPDCTIVADEEALSLL